MDPAFIPIVATTILGMGIGTLTAWLILRNRISSAKNEVRAESNAEIARANERSSWLGSELARERETIRQQGIQLAGTQTQLNRAIEESGKLGARADRVPLLEGQLSALQSSLQDTTNRCSALAEQSLRIPTLEQALETAGAQVQQLAEQVAELRENLSSSMSKLTAEQQRASRLETQLSELTETYRHVIAAKETLSAQVAELTTSLSAEQEKSSEKLALLDKAKERFSDAFKTLANDILEEKSARFTEQNKTNITQILQPLNLNIDEFKKKVEQVYVEESKDRSALKTQVLQLMDLSERVSDDAKNLAEALKGSSKTQGNWGEMILERVLEASGLRKGHEYELRETYYHEDGSRRQPDVVIQLPEDRQLVVDAKVSLTDYERYVNASDDIERDGALEAHVGSVRRHIKELSEKDYHMLYGLKSLDLVVMFVPLEPAFAAAIAADGSLWEEGLRRNVLLVSPSSLLFVLRTVAYLWRQEAQARNVKEIARCGADLYDKFVGFVEDLKGLGRQLQKTQLCHENVSKKLFEGKGHLISRAEKLRQLGVAPKKILAPELLEKALEEPITIDGPTDQDAVTVENEGQSVPVPKE